MPPRNSKSTLLGCLGLPLGAALCLSPAAQAAGFVEDAKATLTLRNFYFNRNYLGDEGPRIGGERQGQAAHWSQNFILDVRSGYTEGPVGFGVDVLGLLSVKLDGDRWSANSQMTPIHSDGYPPDDWGRLAVAGKMRLAKTEVRAGEWAAVLPVLRADDGRSLPQTFEGALLTSKDIESTTLYAGQFRANSPREDGSLEDFSFSGGSGGPTGTSDRFNVLGGEYSLNDSRTLLGAWYAELKDVYDQRYYQLLHTQPIGDWVLSANLGYFNGSDNGEKRSGELNNETFSGLFSAKYGSNTVYLGLMKVRGDSKWMRVNGASGGTLANDGYAYTADSIDEKSWQLRHDYDFASWGFPGLTLMNRYIRGWDIDVPTVGVTDGKEWIRETELAYVVQSGSLKSLNLKLRSSTVRRDYDNGQDFNEYRLIINYPLSLL